MKYIEDVESEKFTLEVYECECGMHFGFDITYLVQVSSISGICQSCKTKYFIESYEGG